MNIEKKIMWAAIENYTGLWEFCWELASAFPENRFSENRNVVQKILLELSAHKFIALYRHQWGSESYSLISESEVINSLTADANWEPPEIGQTCIVVSATKLGEIAYDD
jgi:hypothetical protein